MVPIYGRRWIKKLVEIKMKKKNRTKQRKGMNLENIKRMDKKGEVGKGRRRFYFLYVPCFVEAVEELEVGGSMIGLL